MVNGGMFRCVLIKYHNHSKWHKSYFVKGPFGEVKLCLALIGMKEENVNSEDES